MIGAGILALPNSLYSIGLISFLFISLLILLIIYFSSLILLKSSLKCYKTGLIEVFERYLGKNVGKLSFIIIFFSIIFVCIIYLNIINFSLKYFVQESEIYTLFISSITMSASLGGIKLVEKSNEFLFTIKILIIIFFLLLAVCIPKKYSLKCFEFNLTKIFNSILVLVFSFSFYTIIPSLLYITKNERILKTSIIYSILIGFFIYFIFSYIVSLRSGDREISTLGYNELFNFLTIFLVVTPYLTLSWVLGENINEKLKIKKRVSILISYSLPYILFIFLPKSFLMYIEITSAFFILTIYFLIGLIGYKYSQKLKVNRLYSLFLIIFSWILILFKFLDLIII